MDLLVSKGIAAYAVDLRGMGATSRDISGWTTPAQSVEDVRDVIDFLAERGILRPVLIGWSQGALIAQIFAQKYPSKISSLVLYGSIYNPDLMNPSPEPLVGQEPPYVLNTMESAMEDWTVPGLIDAEAARAFGTVALCSDPRKVSWGRWEELLLADPGAVRTPTLVVYGEKDGYTSPALQQRLFDGLASARKQLVAVGECDHPVHLYPRQRVQWLHAILAFLGWAA